MNGTGRISEEFSKELHIKAIVDGIKQHYDKQLKELREDFETRLTKNRGAVTNLGPSVTVDFPTDQLANVLAEAFAKAVGSIRLPEPKEPKVTMGPTNIKAEVNNDAVAKALVQVGKLFSEAALPVGEAVDLSPLYELAEQVKVGNDQVAKVLADNAKAMSELVKALNRPRDTTEFQQRILDELTKE